MKPKHIVLFVLWLLSSFAHSQNKAIDSLQNMARDEVDEVALGKIYAAIGFEYFKGQTYFDSAYYYSDKALRLAKDNAQPELEARAIFNIGIVNSMVGKHEESITNYLEAKNLYERANNEARVGAAYNNIGGSYFELGKYDVAIENYQKALAIALKTNEHKDVAIDYMNIGEAHYIQGRYQKAKEFMELALVALEKTDFNPPTIHLFYARTLLEIGELEAAKKEAFLALGISQKVNDLKYTSESAQLLANIFIQEKEFEIAYKYQQISNEYGSKLNNARESNEIEKLKLNFELSEQKKELAFLAQRDRDQNIIYILAGVGVLLLLVLIFRQRKIVGMTQEIHTVQRRLVENELDNRELKAKRRNVTGFQAAKAQDREL